MLVLSRKNDQEILLGDQIRVRVLSIRGNTVRLGIDAPQSVGIKRGELVARDRDVVPMPGSTDWSFDEDLHAGAKG